MRMIGMILVVAASCFWSASIVFGISLEEAKAKGLVGEKANGYLGIVTSSGQDVQALTNDVNRKRRQAYEDIARRNKTPLDAVETLAGEKTIQNTQPGNYVEGSGGWVKK